MNTFEAGQWVRPKVGVFCNHRGHIGTVEESISDGYYVRVKFEDGIIERFAADEIELAPATEPADAGDMPVDGETFADWVTRRGESVEYTAFYWKQIASDNLELASVNASLLANALRDCERLSGEYDRGWNGATQSMLSLFERALDTALESEEAIVLKRLLAEFRAEYPKQVSAKGGE